MNHKYFVLSLASLLVGALGCSPPVMLPPAQEPLDSIAWQNCANDAKARAGRSMLDDMAMDSSLLLCEGVVLSNDESKVDEAVEMVTEAALTDKSDHRAYYVSARILTDSGRYEEALTHFARAKKRAPEMEVPTIKLAKEVQKNNGNLEAMLFLEKANKRNVCEYSCKGMLADLYHQNNRVDDAKALYEKMLAENDREPEAYIGLARIANTAGDFKEESDLLKKAMKTKGFKKLPSDHQATLHHNHALALYNSQRYEKAKRELDEALRFKSPAEWLLLAGWIQMRLEDPAMALIQFEKAVDEDKKLSAAHVGIGDATKAMGNLQNAKKAYQQAAYLSPTDGEVKLKLAAVYIELNDFDKAKIQLSDAVKLGEETLPKELLQDVTEAIAVHDN